MCIVVEESDETVFWLEMIEALEIGDKSTFQKLLKEGNEILAIAAKSKKTTGKRIKK